ncbi:DNA methyltransferase [Priestia megaterium]
MLKDIISANQNKGINDKEIAILKKYFPSCFNKEGNFNIQKLENLIQDKVDITREGYELRFLGQSYSKLLASLETETIVMPNLEHNQKEENKTSENLYVVGDNLDGLKHLLKSYSEQVKCIYVDPPYNTGKDDFIYADNFNFSSEELEKKLGIDVEHAQRIIDMTSKGSASHSAWLTFMYSRLFLAKDLLTDDGVMFISIDGNELANLKLLCDDIFGEVNCLGTIVWKNATDNNPTNIAIEHEYILCYCANRDSIKSEWKSPISNIKTILLKIEEEYIAEYGHDKELLKKKYTEWYRNNKSFLGKMDGYKFIDNEGIYAGSRSVHNPGKEGYFYDIIHPVTKKPCKKPLMGYRFPESSMKRLIEEDRIIYGTDENKIVELKVYARDYTDKLASVIDLDGRSGANMIRQLFDNQKVFTNPKPVELLKHLFSFVVNKGDIVLDLFGGSSTTAQAVLELNSEDTENKKDLRFILLQLNEECKKNSNAFKLNYQSIDEIGIERIIRASKKIKEETEAKIDYGFKCYHLITPNQNTLDKIEDFQPETLVYDATILEDFGIETILATWVVQDGYGFNADIKEIKISDYTGYVCGQHLYLLEENMSPEAIKKLIEKYEGEGSFNPDHIVLFGYSFNWSSMQMLKDNIRQIKNGDKKLNVQIITRY